MVVGALETGGRGIGVEICILTESLLPLSDLRRDFMAKQ